MSRRLLFTAVVASIALAAAPATSALGQGSRDARAAHAEALMETALSGATGFDLALDLVRAAAPAIGVEGVATSDLPPHGSAADALRALLEEIGSGVHLSESSVAALDALEPNVASALGRVASAFLLLHRAGAGDDLSAVFGGRLALLQAARDLDVALAARPASAGAVPTIFLPPYVSIDLSATDNTYTFDFALLVDAGGDDLYLNNAGGSTQTSYCSVGRPAALLDFAGNDRYGPTGRLCGVNGGASLGTGFLLDVRGRDTYTTAGYGGNGGARSGGAGFLLDLEGDDLYDGGDTGANGGANVGSGFLLDLRGNDTYRARGNGTNGAGHGTGAGFLMDADGNDTYEAKTRGVNGGAFNAATGLLLDARGNDTYLAGRHGVNGGVSGSTLSGTPPLTYGLGLLFDGGGRDLYVDDEEGAGYDRSSHFKGFAGFQVDHETNRTP